MKTSKNGIQFIKQQEGLRKTAYSDGFIGNVQKFSIGYGHQIQPNEMEKLKNEPITEEEAEKLLKKDVARFEKLINAKVKKQLTQSQYDALVSFGYNCGEGALEKVIKTLNSLTLMDVINHILKYIFTTIKRRLENGEIKLEKRINKTLQKRREAEAKMLKL